MFLNYLEYYRNRLKFNIKRCIHECRHKCKYYTISLNPPILKELFYEHSFPNHSLFELAFLDTPQLSNISDTQIKLEEYTLDLFLDDIQTRGKTHLINFKKNSNIGGILFIKEDESGDIKYEDLCKLFNTIDINNLYNYEIVVDSIKTKNEVVEMIPLYKLDVEFIVKTKLEHYKESVEYMLPKYKNEKCKFRFHMKKNA